MLSQVGFEEPFASQTVNFPSTYGSGTFKFTKNDKIVTVAFDFTIGNDVSTNTIELSNIIPNDYIPKESIYVCVPALAYSDKKAILQEYKTNKSINMYYPTANVRYVGSIAYFVS